MAVSSLATAVMTPLVLDWIAAASVVLSTFWPSAFFSSTPVSSIKAPRVPEPSSREMTVMSWSASKSAAASLSAGAASLEAASEEAVLSEAAGVESAAELPQAARLIIIAAAVTTAATDLRFIDVLLLCPKGHCIAAHRPVPGFPGYKAIVLRRRGGFDHSQVQSP